jgi:superfamily I DNA/RNA helicase
LEAHTYKRAPNGENLRILRSSNERQQKGLAIEEIRRLLRQESVSPSQIALIGASAKRNGSLVDVEQVDGTPLVTGAEAWRDGGGILVTTARSFKGLEADVVILYDLGEFGRLFKREDLYVACTRARVLLIAIVHGVQCRAVMEAAAAAAEG